MTRDDQYSDKIVSYLFLAHGKTMTHDGQYSDKIVSSLFLVQGKTMTHDNHYSDKIVFPFLHGSLLVTVQGEKKTQFYQNTDYRVSLFSLGLSYIECSL